MWMNVNGNEVNKIRTFFFEGFHHKDGIYFSLKLYNLSIKMFRKYAL